MNTGVLEERGAIVENEVDAGELLPRLNGDAGESAEKDLVVGTTEAVKVGRFAQLLLLLEGDTDLFEFRLEFRMVGWEGNETGEGTGSIRVAFSLDEPSRRLREKNHPDGEDETPDELDGNWNPPGSVRGCVLCGVIDNSGEKETDGNRPLITRNDRATVGDRDLVSDRKVMTGGEG